MPLVGKFSSSPRSRSAVRSLKKERGPDEGIWASDKHRNSAPPRRSADVQINARAAIVGRIDLKQCVRLSVMLCTISNLTGALRVSTQRASTRLLSAIDRPRCSRCYAKMTLARITQGSPGFEIRSFECPECDHAIVQRIAAESLEMPSVGGRTAKAAR